jgi:hypothetical protein
MATAAPDLALVRPQVKDTVHAGLALHACLGPNDARPPAAAVRRTCYPIPRCHHHVVKIHAPP